MMRSTKLSPFPTSCLPPVLRRVTEATASTLNVPEILPAAAALSVVSASLGKGLEVVSGPGRRLRGNLFLLVSAPSGAGKSAVQREMLEPHRNVEEYLRVFERDIPGLDGSNGRVDGEPFPGDAPLLIEPPSTPPRGSARNSERSRKLRHRMICENVTGPALASLLSANRETIFNVSTEAGNLLDAAVRPSSELGLLLLKGFSGDPVEIDRLTRDAELLESPCISVFWLCQPHRLDGFLSRDRLIEDGLIARFLVAHSEARMAPMGDEDPGEIPVAAKDQYGAVVEDLRRSYHSLRSGTRTVSVSPGGSAVLKVYHNECVGRWNEELRDLRPCVARWPEQARRIGLVLHAAEHGGRAHEYPLSEETADAAVSLARWFSEQQLAILGRATKSRLERLASRLFSFLQDSSEGRIKVRDLKNSHGFTDAMIDEIVKQHPDSLELQNLQNPKGGPPSRMVVLTQTERNDDANSFRVRR